jgi:hypothetical protein
LAGSATADAAGSAGRSAHFTSSESGNSAFKFVKDIGGQLPEAIQRQSRELLSGLVSLRVERSLGEQEARHILHALQAVVFSAHKLVEHIRTELHELRHTKPQQLVPSPVRPDVSLLIAQT